MQEILRFVKKQYSNTVFCLFFFKNHTTNMLEEEAQDFAS